MYLTELCLILLHSSELSEWVGIDRLSPRLVSSLSPLRQSLSYGAIGKLSFDLRSSRETRKLGNVTRVKCQSRLKRISRKCCIEPAYCWASRYRESSLKSSSNSPPRMGAQLKVFCFIFFVNIVYQLSTVSVGKLYRLDVCIRCAWLSWWLRETDFCRGDKRERRPTDRQTERREWYILFTLNINSRHDLIIRYLSNVWGVFNVTDLQLIRCVEQIQ